MPKIIGPLFSLDASGLLGKALQFTKIRDNNFVRKAYDPHATKTEALKRIQAFMRHTVWTWRHITENISGDWDLWASNYFKQGSGFNAFTSYYMVGLIAGQVPDLFPP